MEQKRIKVRLTKDSPYSDYGYYKKGDIGYIDGYVNDDAVIILENGKFAKADLRWIEVANEEFVAWLKGQGQKPAAWSEEDENRINRLIAYFEDKESFTAEDDIVYANWLKSLRHRAQWKPSDEQMDMLAKVCSTLHLTSGENEIMESIYDDLKKLKG